MVNYSRTGWFAATNRNLAAEVEAGRFRADLYHRLNVYPITVPALRERKDDIAILAGFFIGRTQKKLGLKEIRLSQGALRLLSRSNLHNLATRLGIRKKNKT